MNYKEKLKHFKRKMKKGNKLKTLDERIEFIESNNLMKYVDEYNELLFEDTSNRGSYDAHAISGQNPYYEIIFTYLVRAQDIEGPREGEYPFHRDSNRLYNSAKHTMLLMELTEDGSGSESGYPNESIDMLYLKYNSEYCGSKDYEDLTREDKMSILKYSKSIFGDDLKFKGDDKYLLGKMLVDEVLEEIYSNCSDDTEVAILDKVSEGLTYREIAEELGLSKSNVHKIVKRLVK